MIQIIFIDEGTDFYVNKETKRIKFNTTTEMMEVSFGTYNSSTGVFTSHLGETSNYTPDDFYAFLSINGFIRSVFKSYGNYLPLPVL